MTSAEDRLALAEYGLPDDVVMTPSFQTDSELTLVANLAVPRKRELAGADDRFYDLGSRGGHDLTPRMGAVRGDGRVMAVRSAPLTAADGVAGPRGAPFSPGPAPRTGPPRAVRPTAPATVR